MSGSNTYAASGYFTVAVTGSRSEVAIRRSTEPVVVVLTQGTLTCDGKTTGGVARRDAVGDGDGALPDRDDLRGPVRGFTALPGCLRLRTDHHDGHHVRTPVVDHRAGQGQVPPGEPPGTLRCADRRLLRLERAVPDRQRQTTAPVRASMVRRCTWACSRGACPPSRRASDRASATSPSPSPDGRPCRRTSGSRRTIPNSAEPAPGAVGPEPGRPGTWPQTRGPRPTRRLP